MPAAVEVEGLGGRRLAGRVERINPSTEPGTRTINLYVSLANEELVLKAGMFARVILTTMPEAEAQSLPMSALRDEAGQSYVWVIGEGRLVRRNVVAGTRDEPAQLVAIVSGLAPTELVLATKFDNLKDGQAAKMAGAPVDASVAQGSKSGSRPPVSN
jgi:multidrug efflux pump subunit AcrA (membrane-fusion protein)